MGSKNYWYNGEIKSFAQELRKNMTSEERHLWYDFLKQLPVVVKRQKIIQHYVADFYIPSAKTVIELDGSQHYMEDGQKYDSVRNAAMEELGIQVLRYSNADINLRFDAVCEDILNSLPRMGKVAPKATDEVIADGNDSSPRVLSLE